MKKSDPSHSDSPRLLILNQMCGPLAWETTEDIAAQIGPVALLTGYKDTLDKGSTPLIQLHAAPPYVKGSHAARIWSWLRYQWKAFFWLFRWSRKTPVFYFSNPPIVPWVGWIHRLLRGQRYAVMVYDIWPDYMVRLGQLRERGLIHRLWRWLNRHAYQRAEVVMTLGTHMAKNLREQFDPACTPSGDIPTIYPWADVNVLCPLPKPENPFAKQHRQVDKLTVMYSGNMGLGHDIATMLAAAEKLRSQEQISFMFIGGGPRAELVQTRIREDSLTNVSYLPLQPEDQLPYSLSTADVALVSLEAEVTGLALPSKAFSFFAVGTPLLVMCSQNCELADIIRQYDCGWVVTPGDVDALRQLLADISADRYDLTSMKARSRQAAEKIGSRANTRLILAALEPLLGQPVGASSTNPVGAATEIVGGVHQ